MGYPYLYASMQLYWIIVYNLICKNCSLAGPKDLPIIARTAGRLAGRAIGYVQLARGQFDNVMQQTQARQVYMQSNIVSSVGICILTDEIGVCTHYRYCLNLNHRKKSGRQCSYFLENMISLVQELHWLSLLILLIGA